MKEPPLLMTVQRIIGGVQVQHDLRRWLTVRFNKDVHEQPLDRLRHRPDLVIARNAFLRVQLQPVQRALARQWCTARALRLKLPEHRSPQRIVAQCVVIV